MEVVLASAPKDVPHSRNYQKQFSVGIYKRLQAVLKYEPSFAKLKSPVTLFRPSHGSLQNIEEDYGLSAIVEKPVEIAFYKGNHITILQNPEVGAAISESFKEGNVIYEKETPISALKNVEQISVKQI